VLFETALLTRARQPAMRLSFCSCSFPAKSELATEGDWPLQMAETGLRSRITSRRSRPSLLPKATLRFISAVTGFFKVFQLASWNLPLMFFSANGEPFNG